MSPDNPDKTTPKEDLSLFGEVNLVGQKVAGRWEIVELLGEGNLSTIYRAEEELTRKAIVLKLIHKNLTANVLSSKRLEQRARELIALNHEHISHFYDIYVSPQEEYFLFCDYFVLETLEEVLSECGRISVERATRIFEQAADGLNYAHQQKILHRDLKPSNICLVNDQLNVDDVKLVDFGIARLITEESEDTKSTQYITHTREIFGSVLYMSPEQCAGKTVDARSDIYSLGCVMYEAINGKPPFVGKNVMETAYKHMNDAPAPLAASSSGTAAFERFQSVIFKALKKNPQERYQSMGALKNDLEILLAANDADWQTNAYAGRRPQKPERRHWTQRRAAWCLAMIGLGGCLLFGVLAVAVVSMLNSTESEDYPLFDNNCLWVVKKKSTTNAPHDLTSQREALLQQLDLIEHSKTKYSKEYEEGLAKLCLLDAKTGNWAGAAAQYEKLIDVQNRANGPLNLAEAYANLATCYFWQGDLNSAKEASLKVLELSKQKNVRELAAEDGALVILGDIYTRNGDNVKAKEIYLRRYGFWDKLKLKYPGRYAVASAMLADTYRRQGQLVEAEQFYKNSLEWFQNYVSHQDAFIAKALYGLGLVLQGKHRYAEAYDRYVEALPMAINTTDAHSALVGAIRKESTECLFHTDFWRWLNQKINQK